VRCGACWIGLDLSVDSPVLIPFCCILAALQVGLRYRGMDRVFVCHFAFRSIDTLRGEVRDGSI
jgi:hypothetical protein